MLILDSVLRSHYYKYFHPKECLVSNGVLNRSISQAAGKHNWSEDEGDMKDEQLVYLYWLSFLDKCYLNVELFPTYRFLNFVYPFGATLNVAKPAIAVLSTGSVALPLQRPVCAFYKQPGKFILG